MISNRISQSTNDPNREKVRWRGEGKDGGEAADGTKGGGGGDHRGRELQHRERRLNLLGILFATLS